MHELFISNASNYHFLCEANLVYCIYQYGHQLL